MPRMRRDSIPRAHGRDAHVGETVHDAAPALVRNRGRERVAELREVRVHCWVRPAIRGGGPRLIRRHAFQEPEAPHSAQSPMSRPSRS